MALSSYEKPLPDLYDFHQGTTPLLFSIPHAGTAVPDALFSRLSEPARKLPDTDWHLPRLYDFAKDLGASLLQANYSRYVVDLNRPPDNESLYPGQATTGLCPETLFDGTPVYKEGKPLSDPPNVSMPYRWKSPRRAIWTKSRVFPIPGPKPAPLSRCSARS